MARTKQIELVAIIDENGDYGAGVDEEAAREDYANRIQALEDAAGLRTVRLALTVPLPSVISLAGCVADEGGAVELVAAPAV